MAPALSLIMSKTRRKWVELDYSADGSLRAEDIPYDGTDSVKDKLDDNAEFSQKNLKNLLAISLDLAAVSNLENNDNLTFFVDSFDTDDFIDGSSTNFDVNTAQGYVGLTEGGALQVKDTTVAEFNQGTYTNTEAGRHGGDGKLRKAIISAGGINILEDFDDLTNVTTTGDATQSLTTNAGLINQGAGAICLAVDFSGSGFTESSTTEVDLVTPVDISLDSTINISYLKTETGPVDFVLRVEDNTTATYDFASVSMTSGTSYQTEQFNISSIAGIDTTNVLKFYIILNENSSGQTFIDVPQSGATEEQAIDDGTEVDQTFQSSTAGVITRIGLNLERGASVTDDLQIAISNYFGTTLATASISSAETTATMAFYVIDLSQEVLVQADQVLKIQLQTDQSGGGGSNDWRVLSSKNASVYADGEKSVNGSASGEDIFFTLYTAPPSESIYFDGLEREGASTYQTSGSFLSRAFNLGVTPDTLDLLSWTEVLASDDVEVRVRFATTQGGLTSATWSAWFTDPTGAGNNLTGETPAQWFQYETQLTGGTAVDTSTIDEITLDYSVSAGTGSADVRSVELTTSQSPTQFMIEVEDEIGSGTITYFVTCDGGTTWQTVTGFGELLTFNHSGTSTHVRAVMTGNAKLYGWSIATDEDFS